MRHGAIGTGEMLTVKISLVRRARRRSRLPVVYTSPPPPGDSQVTSAASAQAGFAAARSLARSLRRVTAASGRCPECQSARTMARDCRPHVSQTCRKMSFLSRESARVKSRLRIAPLRCLCAPSAVHTAANSAKPRYDFVPPPLHAFSWETHEPPSEPRDALKRTEPTVRAAESNRHTATERVRSPRDRPPRLAETRWR